jgi:hypothetical protein
LPPALCCSRERWLPCTALKKRPKAPKLIHHGGTVIWHRNWNLWPVVLDGFPTENCDLRTGHCLPRRLPVVAVPKKLRVWIGWIELNWALKLLSTYLIWDISPKKW